MKSITDVFIRHPVIAVVVNLVIVLVADSTGRPRARLRPVESGPLLKDGIVILRGIAPGEEVAASGSFKLRDGALVRVAAPAPEAE